MALAPAGGRGDVAGASAPATNASGSSMHPNTTHAPVERRKVSGEPSRASARPPCPATGAWMPGDPVGRRQFLTVATDRPFALDGGGVLTRRRRSPTRPGARSTTATATPSSCATPGPATATPPGAPAPGHSDGGWWDGMIGPGLPLDTDRWFVVCANVLGGCQGTTGPASPRPGRRPPVRLALPGRDDPRHGAGAGPPRRPPRRSTAGTRVVGGSMGGMQVLEWAITFPDRVRSIAPDRHLRAGVGAADRVGCDRAAGDPPRPPLAGRRLLRRRARATARTRAWRSPAWSPR